MASCQTSDFSGALDNSGTVASFEAREFFVPQVAFLENETHVLGVKSEEKWIEVDLSDQKLKAWEGEFRIWIKLRSARMQGGVGRNYYNLPNVPYIMYFSNSEIPGWRGYGLHGTYWHSDFGVRRSHGCVNLPIAVAETLLLGWPGFASGKSAVKASENNIGTRIVIHD